MCVARSRGLAVAAARSLSARHGPLHAARGCGTAPTVAPGLSTRHGPLRAARGCGTAPAVAPGLSARHGPLRVACGCSTAFAAAPGLSAGHTPSFLEMHLRGERISAHTHKPSLRTSCSLLASQASIAQKLTHSQVPG